MTQSRSKVCFKCGESKPLCEYYKHAQMADGHLNKCKECAKRDSLKHRSDNLDEVREYDRNRASLQHRRERAAEVTRKWREKHPDRRAAQVKVGNAIRSGKLKRPSRCSKCKAEGKVEAHHWSYKPEHALDIEWLCPVCHAEEHYDSQKVMLF